MIRMLSVATRSLKKVNKKMSANGNTIVSELRVQEGQKMSRSAY